MDDSYQLLRCDPAIRHHDLFDAAIAMRHAMRAASGVRRRTDMLSTLHWRYGEWRRSIICSKLSLIFCEQSGERLTAT